MLALLVLTLLLTGLFAHSSVARGLAAAPPPPAPPTFVPTPIGPPPGPPTRTPTPGTAPAPTPPPTAPATVTPTTVAGTSFSLDAARVSQVNNPGNLIGLAAVKPGSKVWLMMYYTVRTLQKSVSRVTTYSIKYKGKVVYKVAYNTTMKRTELGRFSRYTAYSVPASLPYGPYVYRARLTIGMKSQSKSWKFSVAKQERIATTGQG